MPMTADIWNVTKSLTVMFTDIKGFTDRTSRQSRTATADLVQRHNALLAPVITARGGTVIKTIGDAFLVTFESPTEAVLTGVALQERLRGYNAAALPEDQIEIRVAINTGEVILDEGDIFGEAVNIASRIQRFAEPNEIYFTEATYLSMNKAEVPSAEIGYRLLKGIPHKVKLYRVLREGEPPPLGGSRPSDALGGAWPGIVRHLSFLLQRLSRPALGWGLILLGFALALLLSRTSGGRSTRQPLAREAAPTPLEADLARCAEQLTGTREELIRSEYRLPVYRSELARTQSLLAAVQAQFRSALAQVPQERQRVTARWQALIEPAKAHGDERLAKSLRANLAEEQKRLAAWRAWLLARLRAQENWERQLGEWAQQFRMWREEVAALKRAVGVQATELTRVKVLAEPEPALSRLLKLSTESQRRAARLARSLDVLRGQLAQWAAQMTEHQQTLGERARTDGAT